MQKQQDARDDAEIDMRQQPIAQRARALAIDLFARRISHHDGDAAQADEPRQPTDRHPSAADAPVYAVMEEAPDGRGDQGDGQKSAERVPEARDWVALVYVAPDGLRLTLEDETDLILHLRKILARVDAHERARRT